MNYIPYVNIKQGSRSTHRFSNGNTLPMTQLPFAMHAFVPQTKSDQGNWYYCPDDKTIEGVRLSHQPSPWIGDYTPPDLHAPKRNILPKPRRPSQLLPAGQDDPEPGKNPVLF